VHLNFTYPPQNGGKNQTLPSKIPGSDILEII
jgi:hypothetical protein